MALVTVDSIEFSDGTRVIVPAAGSVIFVGPNNAGKSQALKDLLGSLRERGHRGPTLKCSYTLAGAVELQEWLRSGLPAFERGGVRLQHVPGWGDIPQFDIVNHWNSQSGQGLSMFTPMLVLHADGNSRLTAGDSQPSLDLTRETPTHPVQRAYADSRLAAEVDRACRSAFSLGVTVDRYGGSRISLRLGEHPEFEHDDGLPTMAYLDALKKLPTLEEQGDGVRSYLGLMLHIVGGSHNVLLIDEPEAFLHPPQARRLGRVLTGADRGSQLFISTHSTDVVQGALEGGGSVTIVRITRVGDVNDAAVLSDDAVSKLWSDPLLRYSNVLDGLFHDAVVLCEGDADCRYYSAVIDHLETKSGEEDPPSKTPQLLFTHSGGKGRMASVVSALQSVKVPVIVVADFDMLKEPGDVRKTVEALGGDYGDFESDLRILGSALASTPKPLRKLTLKDELGRVLDELPSENIAPKDAERLRALIKSESGWDKVKSAGLQAVPQGDVHGVCQRLLDGLENLGLFIVPVGELERFVPSVSGHGPGWVAQVLQNKLHERPSEAALSFIGKIRSAAYQSAGLALNLN